MWTQWSWMVRFSILTCLMALVAVSPFWRPLRCGSVGEYPSTTSESGFQRIGSWREKLKFVNIGMKTKATNQNNGLSFNMVVISRVTYKSKKTTSPPSPELDFPPNRFIAIAIASCVSLEIAPRDIPPVQKRCTMEVADSTFPTGIGALLLLNSKRSRRT